MAVDVIARALAAKASQGGSGNKVPIDITDVMDTAIQIIYNNYSPAVYGKGYSIPDDLAAFYGSKIATAGKDNVDLFFTQFDVFDCHQAFTFEMYEEQYYCFFYNNLQALTETIKSRGVLESQSFIFVIYDIKEERMKRIQIFFTSEDEAPLYITGTESKDFHDLASVKTILTYDRNQVIETADHVFKDNINNLLQGVMSISGAGGDLVSRIEHYKNGVTPLYCGEYSRVSKEWAFVSSINESTTSIVDNFKIYNGTLNINSWAQASTLKDKVSIIFSNGVPSRLVFDLAEEITLTANTSLFKNGIIDTTIAEVESVWRKVVPTTSSTIGLFTTNLLIDAEGNVKTYYCSSQFLKDRLGIAFCSKENVTIPAKTRIVVKLS